MIIKTPVPMFTKNSAWNHSSNVTDFVIIECLLLPLFKTFQLNTLETISFYLPNKKGILIYSGYGKNQTARFTVLFENL
ncbi:uncharacterized protein CANTADRAFT_27664 [Suhomyces tanzawaensis NRRL Y-17324]|uniref:Uncharacterized protein n=1 Tax=Suhomyces tanzawaensis NRRL Y-17324 TaxID=984487 RepID=A0A1E4SB35_9ASCO|nr:uncharacterized protein CANTADRAFT_27664 [Suhomyces tanzawaensis NRRL Y-17324]ODV76612.1 hypothetical protein CANTADRAFT_27664 [Suhomyces tanzawaensis NRRL Y-17324]